MAADPHAPTLEDDEAVLAQYAHTLVEAAERVIADWVRWSIADRAPHLSTEPQVDTAAARATVELGAELRTLLSQDIAEQTENPLQVLRRGVRFATAVLDNAEVAPTPRDDFARKNFPDDLYDLTPASFADVHQSLHEPGLVWGAAKAHVHLRRRREQAS